MEEYWNKSMQIRSWICIVMNRVGLLKGLDVQVKNKSNAVWWGKLFSSKEVIKLITQLHL